MKIIFCLLVLLLLPVSNLGQDKKITSKPDLVFEGTVIKIGPSPGAGSGGIAVYQLVEYRVERVCEGNYTGKDIVIDHLLLRADALKSLKVGSRLCMAALKSKTIDVRYDDNIVRHTSDVVDFYYIGISDVKRSKSACICNK